MSRKKNCSCHLTTFVPLSEIIPNPGNVSSLIYKLEQKHPDDSVAEIATAKLIKLLRKLGVRKRDIDSLGVEPFYFKLCYNASDRNYYPMVMYEYIIKFTGGKNIINLVQTRYDKYLLK